MPPDSTTSPLVPVPALQLTVARGLEELAALEQDWLNLEGRLGLPDFFQSFAWSMRVAELRLQHDAAGYEPLASVMKRNGDVIAIWPLSRQRRAGVWVLRAIDDPFGQMTGVLAASPDEVAELVRLTLHAARRERWAGSASFERVEQSTGFADALAAAGFGTRNSVKAPYIDYAPHASFAALRRSRNKKSMKNLRNRFNRAERAGTLAALCTAEEENANAVARRALANRTAWLQATGKTAPAFRVGGFDLLLTSSDRWGLSKKRLAFELTLDDGPAAQQIGYTHAGRYYAYVSGMDWRFEALGPGQIQLACVIEHTMGLGLTGAELLTPASDYKIIWTDDTRMLADMALGLTWSGRLKQKVWDGQLRPAVKWLYYKLPMPVRRRMAGRRRPPPSP